MRVCIILLGVCEKLADAFENVLPALRPMLGDAKTALDRACGSGAAARVADYGPRLSMVTYRDAKTVLLLCAELGLPPTQPASVPLDRCTACKWPRGTSKGSSGGGGGVCGGCG